MKGIITMSRSSRLLFALALSVGLGFASAGPAAAQIKDIEGDQLPQTEEEAEALYEKLRGAYEAGLLCRDIEPSDDDRTELAALLNEKTRGQVMPGTQLSLIDEARRDVQRLHGKEGCDGPKMSELLGMFDAHLAGVF